MTKWGELVDLVQRTVRPRAFTDPEVYREEQEHIFARCWLFVAHESQISKPGDFITNHMGDESVIICRDGDGRVRVLINKT